MIETLITIWLRGFWIAKGGRCQKILIDALQCCSRRIGLRSTSYYPFESSPNRMFVNNLRNFSIVSVDRVLYNLPAIGMFFCAVSESDLKGTSFPSSVKKSWIAARITPTPRSLPDSQATQIFWLSARCWRIHSID